MDAFRITELTLRDPHAFALIFIFCTDITDGTLNPLIDDSVNLDEDLDGLLDLSFVLGLRPLDQTGAWSRLDIVPADCTAPVEGTTCSPTPDACVAATPYVAADAGICLETVADTTSGYLPRPAEPPAPCFSSLPTDVTITLAGLDIPLLDARVGAVFDGEPAASMSGGLLFGFLTETVADSITISESLPVIGGDPLSSIFPGGQGNCDGEDDRDVHRGVPGWWIYLDIAAEGIPLTEPSPARASSGGPPRTTG